MFVLDIQQSKAEERERHAAKPTKQSTHAHVAHLTDAIVRSTDACRELIPSLNELRSHGFLGVQIQGSEYLSGEREADRALGKTPAATAILVHNVCMC